MRPSVREGHRRRGDNGDVKTRVPTDTCCVHAAVARSTGPRRQLVGNRVLVTRSARSSAGKPRRPTTFPFYKTTAIIRIHPSRAFNSLHGSRVIHHLRVVLVIIIIQRGVTGLKNYIPRDSIIIGTLIISKTIKVFFEKYFIYMIFLSL